MKKIYIFALSLLAVIITVEALYLAQSSAIDSESLRAGEIRVALLEVDEENQILESRILSYSSLLVISSRAAELGFVRPREFIALKDYNSIALKQE